MKQITEEQRILAEKNHNLIYAFLQKYHLTIEDDYGLAAIGLCKAAMTFKEGVSSFATYAYKCMFTTIMMEKRKERANKHIPDNQLLYYQAEMSNTDGDTQNFMNYIRAKENVEDECLSACMFDEYSKRLKDRDKVIFKMLREGYKQTEIAKLVGCSQAKISRVKKKLLEFMTS